MQRLLLRMIGQEEVGQRIRQAREAKDWTQQDLADAVGVATAQSISRYERGETEVPARRLRKIAEATGKPMAFFVQEPDEVVTPGDDLQEIRVEVRELREGVDVALRELEAIQALLQQLLTGHVEPSDTSALPRSTPQ